MHVIEGSGIDIEAVRRAIELSATKYCSVGATLSSGLTEVHHAYVVRDDFDKSEHAAEVIVLGPLVGAAGLCRPPNRESRCPGPEHERMDQLDELVGEVLGDQRPDDVAAPEDDDVLAGDPVDGR